jgi:hypothetical protein
MGGVGFVAAVRGGMMVAKFAEDNRAHGGLFGDRSSLPIEPEALAADTAVNILLTIGLFE